MDWNYTDPFCERVKVFVPRPWFLLVRQQLLSILKASEEAIPGYHLVTSPNKLIATRNNIVITYIEIYEVEGTDLVVVPISDAQHYRSVYHVYA